MSDARRERQRTIEHPVDDAALAVRARDDPSAFAALYDRYVDAVLRYCYGRLGNWADAEDVTSLIFARVSAALPRFREGSFRSWLFTIAHNAVVNSRRDRRPDASLDDALPDTAPTPEDLALVSVERDELRRALVQLPEAQRRVVELRLAGLTGPEIAETLDRSHAAVKMLQLRAIDRLQELLQIEEERDAAR